MATREVKLINKKQVHKFQEKLFQCAEEKSTWLLTELYFISARPTVLWRLEKTNCDFLMQGSYQRLWLHQTGICSFTAVSSGGKTNLQISIFRPLMKKNESQLYTYNIIYF